MVEKEAKGSVVKSEDSETSGFDLIFDYVGGANLYQWLLLGIVAIEGVVLTNHHLGFVFLGADPDHWCQVPELLTSNWTQEEIKNISIPHQREENGAVKWDQCHKFDNNYKELLASYDTFDEAYRSINFTNLETEACQQWNYDQSIYESTVVTHFNLVCENHHYVASIQASYMAGIFLGGLLGPVSDKLLGRRKVILAGAAIAIMSGYAAAFAKSFVVFSICRFFLACGVCVCYNNCYVLLLEYSDKKFRALLGLLAQLPFAIGFMLMPVFAYFFRRWDSLQLSFSTFTLLVLSYIWILPESARWYASRHRDDEAVECLIKVAKWNKRSLPDMNVIMPILETCREDEVPAEGNLLARAWKTLCNVVANYVNLVRTPELRLRSIVIWTLYICVTLVYYGAVFDSASFTSNPFLIVFLGGAMEVPAYTLTQPVVGFWGRRPSLMFCFAATAVSYIGFVVLPDDYIILRTIMTLLGKFFVSSAFAIVYLLCVELYPTSVRTTGLGSASLMGRIGSISAPYVVTLLRPINVNLPTVIFAGVGILAALVSWFLPETKDLEMVDVVMKVEEQGKAIRADRRVQDDAEGI